MDFIGFGLCLQLLTCVKAANYYCSCLYIIAFLVEEPN